MAKLATCPGCTTQLALPENATLSDAARCPRCGDEFALMEVVQFTVPTAELIPASEQSACSEVAEWASQAMDIKTSGMRCSLDVTECEEESAILEDSSSPTELADAGATTTLSDWEARLKRAITSTETFAEEGENPSEASEQGTLHDFSFPHEALEPPSDPEEVDAETPWTPIETNEFDFSASEPTVKSTSDDTIPCLPTTTSEDMAIDTTTEFAPRKKKSRSLSRTLFSASLGVVGIPLGLYALLWIKGPEADFTHLADYLPGFMLPPTLQGTSAQPHEIETVLALNESEPLSSQAEQALPELVEDSEVQPATAEAPVYSGPSFAMVGSEEFGRLLADATSAAIELATGTLGAESSNRRKGNAYMTLCRLAEKCSFINQPELSAAHSDQAAEAQELMEKTLSSPNVLEDLPHIAETWWKFKARPSPGIVLAGRVNHVETTAAGPLAMVKLSESGETVPVLFGGSLPKSGTRIGIVGIIVNDPHSTIPGLSEFTESIVVAHFSVPILTEDLSELSD